jgi:hypothetical protein
LGTDSFSGDFPFLGQGGNMICRIAGINSKGAEVLLACLLTSCTLWAQGELVSARLAGTVVDTDEAPVSQAKVTLSSPDTGLSRALISSADGSYVFTMIPPGRYRLSVEKEGYAVFEQPEIVLAVNQSTSLNPKLQLAGVKYVVDVTAAPPLLNTGHADIGMEVEGKQVVELPLNIRNLYNLTLLSSSANNSTELQGLT